uniref:Small ribosomal subunit protein uS7c n=2 Tax=Prototheca wickerhamii TaxID=3111 RepID=RR7_PROWI|nr:RecName: Full=Small ribosomal subunit protein uS7c; AltName: Full=30S ribosomal protein S7, plastid [Prototheca wickerhamii]AHK09988.1 ribosomal protein S7 [Prototheca wickerhamii]CAB53112.1 30S ribosomal protein S7 [Prototheca wickerhamii]
MSRRRTAKKRIVMPDPVYKNSLLELIVRQVMRNGKKLLAYRIMYNSMIKIAEMTQKDPLDVLEKAIRNVTPLIEVKARRVGGSTYQVPLEVLPERGTTLAIRWILAACRKNRGKPMYIKLTNELIDASNKSGSAIKKKDEIHRMAEANKAFAKQRF